MYRPNGTTVGRSLSWHLYAQSYHASKMYGNQIRNARTHKFLWGAYQYPSASISENTMHLTLNTNGRPGKIPPAIYLRANIINVIRIDNPIEAIIYQKMASSRQSPSSAQSHCFFLSAGMYDRIAPMFTRAAMNHTIPSVMTAGGKAGRINMLPTRSKTDTIEKYFMKSRRQSVLHSHFFSILLIHDRIIAWNAKAGTLINSLEAIIYLYENFFHVHMLDNLQETSEAMCVYVPDLEP